MEYKVSAEIPQLGQQTKDDAVDIYCKFLHGKTPFISTVQVKAPFSGKQKMWMKMCWAFGDVCDSKTENNHHAKRLYPK